LRRVWQDLPMEDRALLNPAFTSVLIARFSGSYQEATSGPAPVTLTFLAVTMILHGPTRSALPARTSTNFLSWLENNDEIRIKLPDKAAGIAPIIREGLLFSLANDICRFVPPTMVSLGARRPRGAPQGRSAEVVQCQRSAMFLGRWLPRAGGEATVLALLGVRP